MKWIGFVLLTLAVNSATATTIYNNLSDGNDGYLDAEKSFYWGNQFQTPSGSELVLTDVIVELEQLNGTGSVLLGLYSDSGSKTPGTLIANINTVSHSSIPAAPGGQVTFTPTSTITLQSDTQYWIVLEGSSTGLDDARWMIGTTDSGIGVASEY